jgi:hypothetical protein
MARAAKGTARGPDWCLKIAVRAAVAVIFSWLGARHRTIPALFAAAPEERMLAALRGLWEAAPARRACGAGVLPSPGARLPATEEQPWGRLAAGDGMSGGALSAAALSLGRMGLT